MECSLEVRHLLLYVHLPTLTFPLICHYTAQVL